jgi:hypothetical protein
MLALQTAAFGLSLLVRWLQHVWTGLAISLILPIIGKNRRDTSDIPASLAPRPIACARALSCRIAAISTEMRLPHAEAARQNLKRMAS